MFQQISFDMVKRKNQQVFIYKMTITLTVSDVLIITKLNVQSKKMLQATNYYERAYGATVQKSV